MTEISRTALFGKLDPLPFRALEAATAFCRLRGNPVVELQHWIARLLDAPDSDLPRIVRHFGLDAERLSADLTTSLDRLPRGASSVTDLSMWVEQAVERGWVQASLLFDAPVVRTGHLVVGLLRTPSLRALLPAISRQFERVKVDELVDDFARIVEGSGEGVAAVGRVPAQDAAPRRGEEGALARYAVDLTQRAREGGLDPAPGRDQEIRQIIDILLRRRQNNPLLTGEAGVGKTAVVEGFALRVARGDVPPPLKDVSVWALDLGLLQAGAGVKGEFEARLRAVVDEVQASVSPIVLFIDEVHTLVGAGGAAGTGDAANLLKPALARGQVRTLAATTWAEYKRHIEKDPALARRFQVVTIDEPDDTRALQMLRAAARALAAHHGVTLLDEGIEAAVRLSRRYIPARQLPDKAVALLDTACARVAIGLASAPAPIQDALRRVEALELERDIVQREGAIGMEVEARRRRVAQSLDDELTRLAALQARHAAERALVDRVLALRTRLHERPDDADRPAHLAELARLQHDLSLLQGDDPLRQSAVDAQAVAAVVQDWTGIPVGRMVRNEAEAVLSLATTLGRRVIGQPHALDAIASRVQTSRAGLDDPARPVGVFLLCGPSGVGKTETALALAEALYGGEQNVITINMSEFQEPHTVSTLKGAPPGYVGYGEGGVLTEAVRRRPYSVVLLDEVEKAHPDVHELFFQVFDKGWMEDGEGRRIDFKHTLILLTSNVGSEQLLAWAARDKDTTPEALARALREPLRQVFPAALLGRLVTVPYLPLDADRLREIVRLRLQRIAQRVREQHDVPFTCDDAVIDLLVSRCSEVESGGRLIDALLAHAVLPRIGREVLQRLAEGREIARVALGAEAGQFTFSFDHDISAGPSPPSR